MVHTKSLNQLGRPCPTRAVRGKTIATAARPPLPLSLHLAACRSRLSVNRMLCQDGGGGAQA